MSDHTNQDATRGGFLSASMDFLGGRERVFMMIGVWLAVYPTVTLLTYLTSEWDSAPTYLRTFVTTILTVPFITFIVVPTVKKLIREAKND